MSNITLDLTGSEFSTQDLSYPDFDAIIFDMDGTLVDSGQLHQHAWLHAFKHFDMPVDFKLMRSLAGVPTIGTLEVLVKHFNLTQININAVANLKEHFTQQNYKEYVKPTTLEQFALQNHLNTNRRPMAVGTGAFTDEAKNVLHCCNLTHLIDHIVGADQVKNPKPSPDTFLRCAQLMNVEPSRCIVFEDAQAGIQAAQAAGMYVVDVFKEMAITNDYFLTEG